MKKLKKFIFPLLMIIAIAGFLAYQKISADKNRLPENIIAGNVRLEMGRTDIASLYAGKIEDIFVNEGDEVLAGQDLVKLEDTQATTQLAAATAAKMRAEAALSAQKQKQANAQLDMQNARELYKEKLVSSSELKKRQIQAKAEHSGIDAANAAVAEANAQVLRIENIHNDMTLKSPLDGTVEYRLADKGEVVGAGMKIISVLDPTDVSAQIFVPVGRLPEIAVGDDARIAIDGQNAVFPAKVSFIANQAQFTPKYVETKSEREKLMFRVKLVIDKDIALKYKHYLKGGLTATAYISTNKNFPENLTMKLPKE